MASNNYIWFKILNRLESELTDLVVQNLFDDCEIVEITDGELVLSTPSPYRKDIIERNYCEVIEDEAQTLLGRRVHMKVLLAEDVSEYRHARAVDKQQTTNNLVPSINTQFTFQNFVIGSSNRFAAAAARAVAENPGLAYNPLFIYGMSGLGKTHLLYAIANAIQEKNPNTNILYIKGDEFTNELITAIGEGRQQEFHNKYRNADLFLMDDIQFIAGKDSTQEEFFHTFNALYEANKQIVLTSDRPPKEMLRLEDRLQSRFNWGLIADIQPPDYETRCAIVRNKAQSLGCPMPDDVVDYISENLTANVRQLEGAVNKVVAYASMDDFVINISNVSRAIKDMYKGGKDAQPSAAQIIAQTAAYYSIDESELRGNSRSKIPAEARQIAMYLLRKLTNLSLPEIAKEFGKNHTTVLYSVEKVEGQIAEERASTTDAIRDIQNNLTNLP